MALKVYILPDYDGMSDFASIYLTTELVGRTAVNGSGFNLGLATGSSPKGLYKRLAIYQQDFDPSLIETWNLDEYIGLPGRLPENRKTHNESYTRFMQDNFFALLSPKKLKRHHIPMGYMIDADALEAAINKGMEKGHVVLKGKHGGKAVDISPECCNDYLRGIDSMNKAYVKSIEDAGGIDWWVVGSGVEGHIGFHESGIPLDYDIFLVQLDESTRRKAVDDCHFRTYGESPKYAVTVGAGGVARLSRNVMLIASGDRKAEPVERSLLGQESDEVPISVLQRYRGRRDGSALYVLDEASAAGISSRKKIRKLAAKGISVEDMRP
jgi:glucosamine-6-phosphate deaminase